MYPNRLVCTVLDEMRSLDKTKNYGALLGLIEEVQVLVNRMESHLGDRSDYRDWRKQAVEYKAKIERLGKDIERLERKKEALEHE